MKNKWLFPYRFKWIGLAVLLPSVLLGMAVLYIDFQFDFLNFKMREKDETNMFWFEYENFTNEIAILGTMLGLILLAFSREKIEDEWIAKVRLESLQWATYFNFGVLAFCTLFIFGDVFFQIMVYNMFTPLLFFLARFYYGLYIAQRQDTMLL